MVLILILNKHENCCLYFIKEFNNSQEIREVFKSFINHFSQSKQLNKKKLDIKAKS